MTRWCSRTMPLATLLTFQLASEPPMGAAPPTMTAAILRRCSIVGFVLFAVFFPDNVAAQETNCTLDPNQFGGVGDGRCDGYLNTLECGYDGGDCCECTCVEGSTSSCGASPFVCLDPSCSGETFAYPACTGDIYTLGDGNCESENNYAMCGYDGGDCCECTCVNSTYTCGAFGDFECFDPACPDEVHEQALLYPNCTGSVSLTGGGFCQSSNNNPSCGYDGGDCCACTCVDGPDFSCGSNGLNCLDPACPDEASPYVDTCTGDVLTLSDAWCDEENNNPSCGYDGGDCCGCTCVDTVTRQCGILEFPCVDPNAAGEFFDCLEEPTVSPCPKDVQSDWVVEDTATAMALAEALNCSGGRFTVEWIGTVWVNRTIHVPSGTVLNVTGSESDAGLDGNASIRLFTVTDGYLHLTNLHLSNGRSALGGAIAASGSSVVLDTITFDGNSASNHGGALYVTAETLVSWSGTTQFIGNIAANSGGGGAFYDGSHATWTGETVFSGNSARDGGALYATRGSIVSSNGTTTFANNNADSYGGALYASSTSLVTGSGDFSFLGNTGWRGGALCVENSTDVSWDGAMTFHDNWSTYAGGGAYVDSGSSISWNDNVTFSENVALYGGALFVSGASSVSWTGNIASLTNNTATSNGGALNVDGGSSISWIGNTSFVSNRAYFQYGSSYFSETSVDTAGGALFVAGGSNVVGGGYTVFSTNSASIGGALAIEGNSRVLWTGTATFVSNDAMLDGGALYVGGSSVSWLSDTAFSLNTAGMSSNGGAVFAWNNSDVSWSGSTTFTDNYSSTGGGLFAKENSSFSWSGKTTFSRNRAELSGAAICASDGSTFSWEADTIFTDNLAFDSGGALCIRDHSSVSWSARTTYDNNTADFGGAVFMGYDSTLAWNGPTVFASNTAQFNGGAVGSSVSNAALGPSSVFVNGSTTFMGNECGASGGGLAVAGALLMAFETTDITFSGNVAELAGGAVFVSGTGIGPFFIGVKFISNSAAIGGAVYTTGTGTALTDDGNGDPKPNPSTSDRCEYIGNTATATGGAVESGAGLDLFNNTLFKGNRAGVGGALRLAGVASIDNCSFVENTSDDEQGPAVSNIGLISSISDATFAHNIFACEPGMYLGYDDELVAKFGTVCNGCATACTASGCDIVGQEPSCSDQPAHSNSTGGDVNVTMLLIENGYWRATTTSTEIFECFNTDACRGGVTGSPGYCSDGYTGAYCSICSDGYAAGAHNTCAECSDNAGAVVLLVVLALLSIFVVVAFLYYLVSTEMEGDERGLVARLTKRIPLQSFKIIIVTWQILTQFTDIANVIYPDVYSDFLDGIALLNFDLGLVLSTACVVNTDFHDRLLISTLGPLVCVTILAATYAISMHRNRGSDAGRANVRHRHLSMLLFLTFFVYSSVSSTLFRMFACEELDDGKDLLRADYRIECDSAKHKALQVYAGFMIALYTVGIPLVYAILLFRNREVLAIKARRTQDQHANTISDLWGPYKPSRFYYEVIECGRRVLLAGVVVFIYPNTAAQVAVALMMAVFFVFLSEGLAPYESRWDAWLSRTGHAIVFTSMYVALLLKVDVSHERASSQSVFEVVLVSAHVCMIAAVVTESIVIGFRYRNTNVEDPAPKLRRCSGVVSFLDCRDPVKISPARIEGEATLGNIDDEMENRSQVEECKES